MNRSGALALLVALFACVAVSSVHAAEREYFWNEVSNATQWEEPSVPVPFEDSESGKKYYVDPKSGESVWEFPGKWKEVESEEHGLPYYHNTDTKESSWEKPEDMAWQRVKHDESEL
eukprot:CAMPEP_0197591034 /NCGR_PEP_ID=MMETSP1326-20131121/12579_1 /TAXON_ID=1155430 /ORGANISM="Genus nov. species nov., Strain RCC2288" /LENGTH=116 /DNA_ID=CAMNT_0043156367 /DNA_START=36 /DNA_END=386 /DNA_ORIENTATION=+